VAKIVQVTQANGNPALINTEAVTLVITPAEPVPAGASAIIYFGGGQQIAVRETVAEVKAVL
jgi:hypothetical protein